MLKGIPLVMAEYTTIKVPKKLKRSVDLIRVELAQRGELDEKLVAYLREDRCPLCNQKLKDSGTVAIRYAKIKECPNCGFSKPVMDVGVTIKAEDILTALGAGLLVGLGLYLIAELLRR